jgi:hypothetical protein
MQHAMTLLRASLATGESALPFKRSLVGWILVVLNTLMALTSANFFLGMLKTDVVGWLMMNTCAPSIALFVIGFLLGSPAVMVAASAIMFRYGTLGLFVFSWSGGNLVAQAGHILMTLAVVHVAVDVVRRRRWKALGLGLLLGMAILIPLTIVQTMWINAHPEMVEKLFSGSLMPPEQ